MQIAGLVLLGMLFAAGTALAAVPVASGDVSVSLKHADSIKLSDQGEFQRILDRLDHDRAALTQEQTGYLHYLQAWQAAYRGDYHASDAMVGELLEKSHDTTVLFRTKVLKVNTLAERSRYEEAFQLESQLLARLPEITDADARGQALVIAAYLYEEAGQYDLAFDYADQVFKESPGPYSCKAEHARLAALYKSGRLEGIDEQFRKGIEICTEAKDPLYSNGIRFYMASLALQRGHAEDAIRLLEGNYASVTHSNYQMLISEFDALLAEAYMSTGQLAQAKRFALQVVDQSTRNEYAESLSIAYRVLYLIEKQQGHLDKALVYHEQYMLANKGYLNAVNARALAYQTVQQQLAAKKLQIDTLSKQNEILRLQQNLDRKATENSRLYIILLVTVLAFIGFWAYRIKRSQLRFMRLARRDGLTGIFNRQHFVNEAELQLQYCRKSGREACLVLIDLDHFKAVNDNYGHAVGDRVLKRAVAACHAHLRSTDIFGRLGGEEFGIVLPECTLEQVLSRAERIRRAIVEVVRGDAVDDICVSASFGVASTARSGHDLRQLLIHADDALYQAKREGRNRVSVSDGRAKPRLGTVGAATGSVQ
ncbi:GGDEF domain-containing protein [Rhodanobacter denitrificans]|uniref:diguanylate cyclase n=1 Tax=Rhodanobacter denitrificans TaxID=666685 RepID=A0A368KDI6_9GAMM|nr:GGDEF domain-containing protein [Rhodanobacter denitrificans]RCS29897.1 GGDEF domain-containing protein [Rhodanobacter denitrificans]